MIIVFICVVRRFSRRFVGSRWALLCPGAPAHSPPLTTIRHPKAELGLGVQHLVSRIRNQALEVESMRGQPELIVRRSVKSLG